MNARCDFALCVRCRYRAINHLPYEAGCRWGVEEWACGGREKGLDATLERATADVRR